MLENTLLLLEVAMAERNGTLFNYFFNNSGYAIVRLVFKIIFVYLNRYECLIGIHYADYNQIHELAQCTDTRGEMTVAGDRVNIILIRPLFFTPPDLPGCVQ